MPNFDATRADVEARATRFPEWARGADEWRRLVASPTPEGLFALMHPAARRPVRRRRLGPGEPRVFA